MNLNQSNSLIGNGAGLGQYIPTTTEPRAVGMLTDTLQRASKEVSRLEDLIAMASALIGQPFPPDKAVGGTSPMTPFNLVLLVNDLENRLHVANEKLGSLVEML